MMTRIIIIFIFFLQNISFSQNISIKYHFQSQGDSFLWHLIITDTASHWQSERLLKKDESTTMVVRDEEIFMVKHYSSKKNYFRTFRIYQKSYLVADSLFPMKWKLSREKKEILGFPCKSATTTFRGRTYTAFYTKSIPLSEGPWKFGGLPGVILEVYSEDGYYKWTAIEYTKNTQDKPRKVPNLAELQFMTWEEYVQAYKDHINRVFEKYRAEAKPGTSGSMKISEMEIFFPEFQTGKGLKW